MTALRSWFPFRFSRQDKRNAEALPSKNGDGGTQAGAGLPSTMVRGEMERMLERCWPDPVAALDGTSRWSGDFSSTECAYGAFRRAIPLPSEVATSKADAKLDKDVLTITLPKTETAKKKAVHVPVEA